MSTPSKKSVTWRVLAVASLAFTSLTSGFTTPYGGTISASTPVASPESHRTAMFVKRRSMDSSTAVLEPPVATKKRGRRPRVAQPAGPTGSSSSAASVVPADVLAAIGRPSARRSATSSVTPRTPQLLVPEEVMVEERVVEEEKEDMAEEETEHSEQELRTRVLIKRIQRGQAAAAYYAKRTAAADQVSMEAIMAIREGQQAKQELVEMYRYLVKSVVNKYAKMATSINEADLETEAQSALIDAAQRFDLSRSNKFTSYAYYYLRNGVLLSAQSQVDFIRVPTSFQKQRIQLHKFHKDYTRENDGLLPTVEEAATHMNLTPNRVESLINFQSQAVNLEKEVKGGDGARMVDMILDPGMQSSLSGYINNHLSTRIESAMQKLTEEEAMVLSARLGLQDGRPQSLEEIRQKLEGRSLQYLRKIEAKAKNHLLRDLELVQFINDQLPKLEALDKNPFQSSSLIRVRR